MQAYDLHIHSAFSEGESSLEQLATTAKQLAYSGICFSSYFQTNNQLEKLKEEIEKMERKIGIKIFLGFEARNLKELSWLAKNRRRFDILLARGGSLKMNRAAVEIAEVDILSHPSYERKDAGIDHVYAKFAAQNHVALEINFREILITNKKSRSIVLGNMKEIVKLAKKYKTPLIISSGAISHWELRDPQVLASFVMQLGLNLKEAKQAISTVPLKIIKRIEERKKKSWIKPGVKMVK